MIQLDLTKDELWNEIFRLQKEGKNICFPDKLRFNDLSLQLKLVRENKAQFKKENK